ncbi:unnamed protein product [Durusdinium trenchii]|uniref:Uncharacterized protein n=2 Tax=Durusdinium trenchii TaxID=1381693 RepID=A0ABP0J2M5_9DINO
MGTVCCVEDPSETAGTSSKIDLDERESAAFDGEPARGLLEGLKGHWTRKEDRMSLGIISGNSMVWEAAYKHKPSPLWEVSGDQIKMSLGGEEHLGRASLKDSEIVWEDGEVWIRK